MASELEDEFSTRVDYIIYRPNSMTTQECIDEGRRLREMYRAALDGAAASSPVEPPPELIDKWMQNELADYAMVLRHCSETYDHFTQGRISKPNTLPAEVFAVADELYQQDFEEAVRAEVEARQASAPVEVCVRCKSLQADLCNACAHELYAAKAMGDFLEGYREADLEIAALRATPGGGEQCKPWLFDGRVHCSTHRKTYPESEKCPVGGEVDATPAEPAGVGEAGQRDMDWWHEPTPAEPAGCDCGHEDCGGPHGG